MSSYGQPGGSLIQGERDSFVNPEPWGGAPPQKDVALCKFGSAPHAPRAHTRAFSTKTGIPPLLGGSRGFSNYTNNPHMASNPSYSHYEPGY